MKAVSENTEAEVDQNAVDRKYDEKERKNILITIENLIANCIAQEVFYTVTNSVLTASRFHELNVVYDVEKSRVVKLKAENSKLLEKIQNDDHDSMNLKIQLKGKMPCVTSDVATPKVSAGDKYAINVEPIFPRIRNNRKVHLDYLKHLKESVETLHEIVDEAKVERPLD
nr:hypothetical protein [Tanacetum cinerariifolium]